MGVIRYNLAQATRALRENREAIAKNCLAPVVAVVVLAVIPDQNTYFRWVSTILGYGVYSVLAVGIHRQILIAAPENRSAKLENYAKFTVWAIAVSLSSVVFLLPLLALRSASLILFICLLIPALYVTARMSLILPNRAVGESAPIQQVWKWSHSHGWQLVGALFVPPFILNLFVAFGTFWMSGVGRDVVVAVLTVPVVVLEVAVLSVAYRDLKARYATA